METPIKEIPKFYHLTGFVPEVVSDFIQRGNCLISGSYARRDPALQGAVMPYEVFNKEKEKEAVFERIRHEGFPDRPSRLGAYFVFDDFILARAKNQEWFGGLRTVCNVQLVEGRTFKADSQWLNGKPESYEQNARKYWSGEMSQTPAPEIIVDGMIRFLGTI